MEEEKKECVECGKTGATLMDDGLCFTCTAKKYDDDDGDEGTWFNKG
jgi:hypothetical protein